MKECIKIAIDKDAAGGDVYELLENISCLDLEIPAGFRCDGASVPRFFWRLIFPPGEPCALRAALLHDYIYRTHPAIWTRAEADRLFRKVLVADGVKPWRAALAYAGVRIFGGVSWRKYL